MLRHEVVKPAAPEPGNPVLVLLHGRGADGRDLLGLRPYLPSTWTLVLPEAPFPAAPWGYGPGWAWYRFLGGNRPEPESFESSLKALDAFLKEVPRLVGAEARRLVLGGFSQGGTLSLAWALARAAGHLGDRPDVGSTMLVNLSGFLADHPWSAPSAGALRGVRAFWGHGTQDAMIPFVLAETGREALAVTGVELRARDYPIGHWIDGAEVRDLVEWIESATGPTDPEP